MKKSKISLRILAVYLYNQREKFVTKARNNTENFKFEFVRFPGTHPVRPAYYFFEYQASRPGGHSQLTTHFPITVLTLVLFMFLSSNSFSQIWTSPSKVAKHKGDSVSLVGFVTSARYYSDARDAPTLINIGGKNSDQLLTLLVKGDDRSNFRNAPETAYTDKYIQVTGKVEIHRGKPRIILHHEKQISIVMEAAPDIE